MTGAPITTTPTPIIYPGHKQRRVKVDAGDGSWVEYLGYAAPNVLEGQIGWQILKNSYDANGELESVNYANSNDGFNFIWTSYLTYTYA
jgi:hypothetical protein